MEDNRTDIQGLITTMATATEAGTVTSGMIARVLQYLLDHSDESDSGEMASRVNGLQAQLSNVSTLGLSDAIDSEAALRSDGDAALQTAITAESQQRTIALTTERAARQTADEALGARITGESQTRAAEITTLRTELVQESQGRASDVAGLDADIVEEARLRDAADTALEAAVTAESQERERAVSGEQAARESADENLQSQIAGEAQARSAAIATEAQERSRAVTEEQSARQSADDDLRTQIDGEAQARAGAVTQLTGHVAEESQRRADGDAALQTAIATEAQERSRAVTEEQSARQSADDELRTQIDAEAQARADANNALRLLMSQEADVRAADIDVLEHRIAIEETARASEDTALRAEIAAERADRSNGDDTLRTQIEASIAAGTAADAAERTAREQGDTRIEGLVTAEQSARTAADGSLRSMIEGESAQRSACDLGLWERATEGFAGLVDEVPVSSLGTTEYDGIVYSTYWRCFLAYRREGTAPTDPEFRVGGWLENHTFYAEFPGCETWNSGGHPLGKKIFICEGELWVWNGEELVSPVAEETAAREAADADLEARIQALASGVRLSLSVSPSMVYAEEETTFTVTGTVTNGTPSSMRLLDGSTDMEGDFSGQSITKQVTATLSSGNKSYGVEAVVNGMTLNAGAVVYARHPIYYGFGGSAAAVKAVNGNRYDPTTSPYHTYERTLAAGSDNQHFYVLVPTDISSPKASDFTMNKSPFVVVKNPDGDVVSGYNVYKSVSDYGAGTTITASVSQ